MKRTELHLATNLAIVLALSFSMRLRMTRPPLADRIAALRRSE